MGKSQVWHYSQVTQYHCSITEQVMKIPALYILYTPNSVSAVALVTVG